jgi:hypothetical protein
MTARRGQELKRWEKRGEALGKAKSANQWLIADWILDGMRRFKKSEVYNAVEKHTGMTRKTLYQFKLTAECFPKISTRVKKLSFGHHRLVANRSYTPEKRRELLLHAKKVKESVASFAAFLRKLDADAARRAEKRTHGDRAADKVLVACDGLRKCTAFETLLSRQPTPPKRNELLEKLRTVIAELTSKVERFERIWSSEEQAVGHAAGK